MSASEVEDKNMTKAAADQAEVEKAEVSMKDDDCASKSTCTSGSDCSHCSKKKPIVKLPVNKNSVIHHVIGVISGKGGVGKSSVTSMLAASLAAKGYKVGILDADITGPSIPQMFGVTGIVEASNSKGITPAVTENGVKMISINLLLEETTSPVIWRGAVISNVVKQFWNDTNWGEIDYLLVDMPPGTGDVPLTVMQYLPVDGIVMVTSPQALVSMIVKKACKMAVKLKTPILGIIENYSYIECPDCGRKMNVFGKSRIEEFAAESNLEVLGKLPIDEKLAQASDEGTIEKYSCDVMLNIAERIAEKLG